MFKAPESLAFGAALSEGVCVPEAETGRFPPLDSELPPQLCWAGLKSPPSLPLDTLLASSVLLVCLVSLPAPRYWPVSGLCLTAGFPAGPWLPGWAAEV